MNSQVQFNSAKFAVLIDADNASSEFIELVIKEVEKQGIALIKRIYGDWSNPHLSRWKAKAIALGLESIQQYSYTSGKNSTDIALIIDAMDLLHTQKLNGFCIVSGDSDYTGLAIRIRNAGLSVFGFGEKAKTSEAFIGACDRFTYTENFSKIDNVVELKPGTQSKKAASQPAQNQASAAQQNSKFDDLRKLFTEAYKSASAKDGWVDLIAFNSSLIKLDPSFNSRKQYGKQFKTLIKESNIFDCQKAKLGTQIKLKHIKQKA